VLIVHFLRFDAFGRKIGRYVEFPEEFRLCDLVDHQPSAEEDSTYELYSVIIHSGISVHAGHYYSYVRSSDGWYYCNDEKIQKISDERRVMKQNAYMLFYRKVFRNEEAKSNGALDEI
jgi:ubiquitin carboxyl-terminal hydrolase 36/42